MSVRNDDGSKFRVLELYSGIGGMHMALKEAGANCQLVSAVDINPTANTVYRHNFPDSPVLARNIEGLTASQLDRLGFNVLLMSPPCQPYSRLGKQKGMSDTRAVSLCKLMKNIRAMQKPPDHLLIENVRGFEHSQTRDYVVGTLEALQFHWREFLLCPSQFGVPNSRLRYYLLARKRDFCFRSDSSAEPLRQFPVCHCDGSSASVSTCDVCGRLHVTGVSERLHAICGKHDFSADPPTLSEFLRLDESDCKRDEQQRRGSAGDGARRGDGGGGGVVPQAALSRYGQLLDLVFGESRRSNCVTRGYGRRLEGTGSLLVPAGASPATVSRLYESARQWPRGDARIGATLAPLNIRWLSVRETARLMCLPDWFCWPGPTHSDSDSKQQADCASGGDSGGGGSGVSTAQMYRLIGNSVNVRVVAALVTLLLSEQ